MNYWYLLSIGFSLVIAALARSHKPIPICNALKFAGNCTGRRTVIRRRYYWSPQASLCLQFRFRGCGGNGNNFATIAECLAECRKADGPTCYGTRRAPLSQVPVAVDQSPSCNSTVCERGFKCKIGPMSRTPHCCEQNEEEWAAQAWSPTCPDGRLAATAPETDIGHPLVAAHCADIKCPHNYKCVQVNKRFARCCSSTDATGSTATGQSRFASTRARSTTTMQPRFARIRTRARPTGTGQPRFLRTRPGQTSTESPRFPQQCAGDEADRGRRCSSGGDPVVKWYYNEKKRECLVFKYEGCGGNANNHATKEQCDDCKPMDGSPCRSNDTAEPMWKSSHNRNLQPKPRSCIEQNATCPSDYRCSHGFMGMASCCNRAIEQLFDDAYDGKCPNNRQPYQISNGQYNSTLLADSCTTMLCPRSYSCQSVNRLFARCCPNLTTEVRSVVVRNEPVAKRPSLRSCRVTCGKGCYSIFLRDGCSSCHCPTAANRVVLRAGQKTPCRVNMRCPVHCQVQVDRKTRCSKCVCRYNDTLPVYTVKVPLKTNTKRSLFACIDFRLNKEYKFFDSAKDGKLFAKPMAVVKRNRVYADLSVRREPPSTNVTLPRLSIQLKTLPGCKCDGLVDAPIQLRYFANLARFGWVGGDIGLARELLRNSTLKTLDGRPIRDSDIARALEANLEVQLTDGRTKDVKARLSYRDDFFGSKQPMRYLCYRFFSSALIQNT